MVADTLKRLAKLGRTLSTVRDKRRTEPSPRIWFNLSKLIECNKKYKDGKINKVCCGLLDSLLLPDNLKKINYFGGLVRADWRTGTACLPSDLVNFITFHAISPEALN